MHFLSECKNKLVVRIKKDEFKNFEINLEELKIIEPLQLFKFPKIFNIYVFFFPGKYNLV